VTGGNWDGIPVLIGFLSLVAVLFFYTQYIGPRLRIERMRREMIRSGWQELTVAEVPEWRAFESIAVEGVRGTDRRVEYSEKRGFRREQVKRDEHQSAVVHALFRSPSGRHVRLAASAMRTAAAKETRQGLVLTGTSISRRVSHELWLGEIRPVSIGEPSLIYSWISRLSGDFLKKMAADRGVSDQAMPEITSPHLAQYSDRLKSLFDRHERTLDAVKPLIYLTPDGWVLTAALKNAIRHQEALEAFSLDLSRTIDTLG